MEVDENGLARLEKLSDVEVEVLRDDGGRTTVRPLPGDLIRNRRMEHQYDDQPGQGPAENDPKPGRAEMGANPPLHVGDPGNDPEGSGATAE